VPFVGTQHWRAPTPSPHRRSRKGKHPSGTLSNPRLTWGDVVIFTTPVDLMGRLSNPPETLENLADQGCYGSSSTRPESPKSLKPSSGSPGSGYSNNKGRLSNPVQRRLTRPQLAQLAEAYAAGSSIDALARTYRVHRTTVISHLDRLAVPRRRVIRKMTDDGVQRAAALCRKGQSLKVVSVAFRVDAGTVAREFRRRGIDIRPRRGAPGFLLP